MTDTTRTQSVQVTLNGDPVAVDSVSWEHGVNLRSGDVVGSSGTVRWSDGTGVLTASQVKHPFAAGWDRTNGAPVTVDVTDNGQAHRVFTGQIESSDGDLIDGSQSKLTDWVRRLNTKVKLPPLAFTMPPRTDVPGAGFRRVGLWGVYYTHLAMAQAGFHPCQGPQRSAVWYQSFCGSAWPFPNPDHATDTLGHLTTCHRIGNTTAAPAISQGRNIPVMSQVYCIGSTLTRRNSSSPFWQVTVDMADLPAADQEGYVDLRPLPLAAGYGFRLSWDKDFVTVWVVDGAGVATDMLIRGREQAMRWSLIIDTVDDWYRLISDEGHDSGWLVNGLGTALPTDEGRATVIVNSPGPISAVQVTRSNSTFLVDQAVSARILRSTFAERSLPGFEFRDWTPAIGVLTEQADAERGLLAMPLWLHINRQGQLVSADPQFYADQPVTRTFSTDQNGTTVDRAGWTVEATGPVKQVNVRARFSRAKVVNNPRMLLAVGSQTTYGNGEELDNLFHPAQDQTWLQVDLWPYLAGMPLPPPADQEFNRNIGTWVGGMEVDENGDRVGWIEIDDIDGWTVDASNHVQGALEMIDHRTIVYKGTVNLTDPDHEMSSLPDQDSVGLFSWRKNQPLPQIRGWGQLYWTDVVTSVEVTGDDRHEELEHDVKDWVQNGVWRKDVADALAESTVNPAPELRLLTAVDPTVEVGEHAELVVTYPDGAVLEAEGLVAGVSVSMPSDRDQMTVRFVVLSSTWTPPSGSPHDADYSTPGEYEDIDDPSTDPPDPLPPEDEESGS